MSEALDIEEIESADGQVDRQDQIDKAFVRSGERELHGLKLQPYSPARVVAAQSMGLRYGFVDEAGTEVFKRTKLYPGAVRDVAIFIWLCGKATDGDLDAAGVEPMMAARKAVEWAEKEDLLDVGKEKFWDAYALMFEVMEDIRVSRSKAEKKSSIS